MDYLKYYSQAQTDCWTELSPAQRYIQDRIIGHFIDSMRIPAEETILDVGCGDGLLLKTLHERGRRGCFGMDISFNAVAKLRPRLFPNRESWSLFQGDMRYLPVRRDAAGGIISKATLEHLTAADLADGIKELYRALKPGGVLVFSVPFREKIKEIVCIHCGRRTPTYGHLQSFRGEEIEALLQSAGFSNIDMKKIISLPNYLVYFCKTFVWAGQKIPFALWRLGDGLGMKLFQRLHLKLPNVYPILLVKAIK